MRGERERKRERGVELGVQGEEDRDRKMGRAERE